MNNREVLAADSATPDERELSRAEREAIQGESDPPPTLECTPMLDSALVYAGLGWKVFPVAPGKKVPIIGKKEGGNGFLDATADAVQIREWWTRYPDAVIGWALDRGLIAIDLDRYKSGCVADALEKEHGPFPYTLTLTTPGGTGPKPRAGALPVTGQTLIYKVDGAPKLKHRRERAG